MRKLIAIVQVTIDGVMQGPGGPEEDPRDGFSHGGWAMPYGDAVLGRVMDEIMEGEFELLLGRWTYELFSGYWPKHTDNPIGAAFDRVTKHVVTHRSDPLGWQPAQRIEGIAGVRELKASDGPELHLWGSHELLQMLIGAGLIDEYRLWVAPVILGEGKRLFETGVPPSGLTLIATQSTSTGVLINTYRPAGPVPKG